MPSRSRLNGRKRTNQATHRRGRGGGFFASSPRPQSASAKSDLQMDGWREIRGRPLAEPFREEIPAGKATQRLPRAIPAEFEPLQTCPKELRQRWQRRAAVADTQPMRAIELKCLDCAAWYRPEAARCEIRGCALWAFNRRIFGSR